VKVYELTAPYTNDEEKIVFITWNIPEPIFDEQEFIKQHKAKKQQEQTKTT